MDERTSGWCDKGGVDLRDFASIIAHFTEREIDEMQAAIDQRRRLARDGKRALEPAEQPDYSPNDVEEESSEGHIQHPA